MRHHMAPGARGHGGPWAEHRSATTMHLIHGCGKMANGPAVHELTHAGQYEAVGAGYMAQALHGQIRGLGYDYKLPHASLSDHIAAETRFRDFNREQQAQICEDYYTRRFEGWAEKSGTLSELEHYVRKMWADHGATFPAGGP